MSDAAKPITVLQLYPRDMNIYGDWGNVRFSCSASNGTATNRTWSNTIRVMHFLTPSI